MRNEKGQWLKGMTGNPRGRPKTGLSIAELCRGQVEKRGLIKKLGEIAARVDRMVDEGLRNGSIVIEDSLPPVRAS